MSSTSSANTTATISAILPTSNPYEDGGVLNKKSSCPDMMDISRSAPMALLQIYIPSEAAHATIAELGDLGLVQFRDVNNILLFFHPFRLIF